VVFGVGHVEAACPIAGDAVGSVELGGGSGAVEVSVLAASGEGGDPPVPGHPAEAGVEGVGDVEGAFLVGGAEVGLTEAGLVSGAVLVTGQAGAGEGGDDDVGEAVEGGAGP
jgi:hypothetical protein